MSTLVQSIDLAVLNCLDAVTDHMSGSMICARRDAQTGVIVMAFSNGIDKGELVQLVERLAGGSSRSAESLGHDPRQDTAALRRTARQHDPCARAMGGMMAKLRTVIEADEHIGAGTPDDPSRILTCFYDLDGTLLWSKDPWRERQGFTVGETVTIPVPLQGVRSRDGESFVPAPLDASGYVPLRREP